MLLLAGAATLLPTASRAQDGVPLGLWVSSEQFPFLDKPVGITLAGNGQAGVEGSNRAGAFGATVLIGGLIGAAATAPMSLRASERDLANHPALAGIMLAKDFDAGHPAAALEGVRLVAAKDEATAHVRIRPCAVLQPFAEGQARMMLLCKVAVNAPGIRGFDWLIHAEPAASRPWFGPDSWTDASAAALHQAVQEQVPSVLLAVTREVALRRRNEWRDPADPATLVHINLVSDETNVFWSYLVLAETPTQWVLARANKNLGHLNRRYVFDKSEVRSLRRGGE